MLRKPSAPVLGATVAVMGMGLLLVGVGRAAAQPPGFPDLNDFQSVDPTGYTAAARAGGATYFVTPDGVQCILPNPTTPGDHVSASCGGPIPGLPDTLVGERGCSGVDTPTSLPTDLGPYGFTKDANCPVLTSPLLNVGQKITAGGITCVVGVGRLTACIDPVLNRGFVLQPSGSWTF